MTDHSGFVADGGNQLCVLHTCGTLRRFGAAGWDADGT